MEPLRNSPYTNGTNTDAALNDKMHQPESGMASPTIGEAVPIYQQASTNASLPLPASLSPVAMLDNKRTIFPIDTVTASAQLFLYLMSRRQLLGASILRWIIIMALLLGAFYFLGRFPGRWLGATIAALAALSLIWFSYRWQRRDFIRFVERPMTALDAAVDDAPLSMPEKLPIHATGRFEVDKRRQRFTWIPGFYRTFATREHAIMCLVQSDQFARTAFWAKLGRWDSETEGMWYAFISPDVIERIRIGQLDFGHEPQPGVAIDYTILLPAGNLFQRLVVGERSITETLYLACESEEACARIFADLQYDLTSSP